MTSFQCNKNCLKNIYSATLSASENGHIECLKYILKHNYYPNQNWGKYECILATFHGHNCCLKLLLQKLFQNNFENSFLFETCCNIAIEKGYIDCFKTLLKCKVCLSENIKHNLTYTIIKNENNNCLKILFETGNFTNCIILNVIINGSIKQLKFLHSLGCSIENICSKAYDYKKLNFIEYAHSHGCSCCYGWVIGIFKDEKIVFSNKQCIICCNNKIKVQFKPCNHQICCFSCTSKLIAKNKCPICKSPIIDILNV